MITGKVQPMPKERERPVNAIFADGSSKRPLAIHPDAIGVSYPTREVRDRKTYELRSMVASDVAEVAGRVAVISVDGPLEHKSASEWWSYWQTYEDLARDFKLVLDDSAIDVVVLKFDPTAERVSLGLKQIQEDPWHRADEKYPVGTRVKGKVVSLTDYGAFIEIEQGVEGLVHVSEMSWTKRVKHPSKMLEQGKEVEAVVLDIDPKAKRISLGMKQIEANPWTLLEDKYPIGSVIKGQVRNVTDFGVFVGVEEGVDGLVHVSDISWTQLIKHPGELYKKGDEVEAVVLNIDVENERFSLGIKQLTPDPWDTLPERTPVGSRVKGKITKVTDFGAFVEIEPGIEGLVHVSEIKDERVENPRDVLTEGQEVDVKIIDINSQDRKIALSIKALANEGSDDYREYLKKQAEGSRARLGDVMASKLKK